MADKPKAKTSEAEKELDRVQEQFDTFDKEIKELTLDRMNSAPKQDVEPNSKMSAKDLEKSKDVYLKPTRSISSKEKFDEKFRDAFNFAMEYVRFIPENKEIIGETIDIWTKPFPGMPAQYWQIPTGKPVWGPRHLAERLTKCSYHRLVMQQTVITEANRYGQMFGALAADTTIQRLDAIPVNSNKSIFMGASSF